MRKQRVLLLYLIVLACAAIFTPIEQAEAGEPTVSEFGESSSNYFGAAGETWQDYGFYSVTLERYFEFYDDDTNVVYVSSVDGLEWTSKVTWRTSRYPAYLCVMETVHDPNTDTVHIVYAGADQDLLYNRGTPYANGTIIFDPIQTVRSAGGTLDYGSSGIAIDSNGYPWIGSTEAADWSITYPFVGKSSSKDGTWTEEFWTKLNNTLGSWQCNILDLLDGKMMALYVENEAGNDNEFYARLWNGTAWEGAEYIGDSRACGFGSASHGDTVYVTFPEDTPDSQIYKHYTFSGGWEEAETIHDDDKYSALCVDTETGDLFRFWDTSTQLWWQKRESNGVWNEPEVFYNCYDELGYTSVGIGSWRKDSGQKMAFIFSRDNVTPYKHHFGLVDLQRKIRFHGLFDEDLGVGGDPIGAVNVTVYWSNITSETFEVYGMVSKSYSQIPLYAHFDLLQEEDVVSQHDLNILIYNGSNYYDILFPTYEEDMDYTVKVSLTWNSTYTVTDKTVTGCRVNFGTPPTDGNEYLDWYVYRSVVSISTSRQYWFSPDEDEADIYIFDTTLSSFTVQFLDLAGALDDYPFIEIRRYINGSLMIVEKRKVDAQDKIAASLKSGEKYTLEVTNGASYTFGDVLFQSLYTTAPTTVTLTLNPILFPRKVILSNRYVIPYAYRHNNLTSISVLFEETESVSCSVEIDILFENLTSVGGIYPYTYGSTVLFNHTWTSANYSFTYVVQVEITHPTFNTLNYNTILARGFSSSPWDFDFIGTIPNLETSAILPLCLIFGSLLIFSKVNAYLAGFVATCMAIFLTWYGWIYIPPIALMASMVLSILLALRYKKKRDIF